MGGFWAWLSSLKAEEWTALGTVILAGLTILIVVVGWIQLHSIRKEGDKARTLAICDRYNFDPILDASARRVSPILDPNSDFRKASANYKSDVVTVLNYLDSLAVGITQGLYIEALARDHTERILCAHYDELLGPSKIVTIQGVDVKDFQSLKELAEKWSKAPPQYRSSRMSFSSFRRSK